MRRSVCRFFAVIAALALSVGVSACTAEGTAELACFNLCDCVSFGGASEERCNSECLPILDLVVEQSCLDCVSFSTCEELSASDACELECQNVQSLELP